MNSPEIGKQFDQDYFENGIRKRKSLYENFRWMPWVSMPMANTIKKIYEGKRILDYGCAHGYLVYSLRLLGVKAYGYDISDYALANCKTDVAKFLYGEKKEVPDVYAIFIKDTLEHNTYEMIDEELVWLASKCRKACFIIPLGDNGRYRIADYHFDATHIIAEDEEWWAKKILNAGFKIDEFDHRLNGFKSNWYAHNPIGNGVFLCSTTS